MTNDKTVREPLFHVVKRGNMPLGKAILIRALAIFIGIILCCGICAIVFKENPVVIISKLFDGTIGTERRIWLLIRNTALLLCAGLALLPAFKMKFWNLGGNGQILIGALVTVAIMRSPIASENEILANILMLLAAVTAGAVWAVIPAIFKAFFNTNESLFTLMMNYIAAGLVGFFIYKWVPTGSAALGIVETGHLPVVVNDHILTIIVVALLTLGMFFYMKHSKQGYEIAVVGESEKTAKYAGINVKKVVIRTLVISGAICGILGLLLAGAVNHSLNEQTANNMGFTGIMVAWIAKFNPLMMILTSFFITFMTQGMDFVRTDYVTNQSISNMLVALVYFLIIACEFFITYKIMFRKKKKPEADFMADKPAEEASSAAPQTNVPASDGQVGTEDGVAEEVTIDLSGSTVTGDSSPEEAVVQEKPATTDGAEAATSQELPEVEATKPKRGRKKKTDREEA